MDDDEISKTYPGRCRFNDHEELKEWVMDTIDRLWRLQESTDPKKGEVSAVNKDRLALEALDACGALVRRVAGWARDHRIGIALEDLRYLDPPSKRAEQHPGYADIKAAVNNHQHEAAGAQLTNSLEFWATTSDPEVERRILRTLLKSNSGGLPHLLAEKLVLALEALDHGEIMPLLAKTPARRKSNFTKWRLRLQALGCVEYLVARHRVEQ